jgi:hypothetical protein
VTTEFREPTGKECDKSAEITLPDGRRGFACWYPQMGGYAGRAIVVAEHDGSEDEPTCFEAFVWHDGEFPFDASAGPPAELHHCDPAQFIQFGLDVQAHLGVPKGLSLEALRPRVLEALAAEDTSLRVTSNTWERGTWRVQLDDGGSSTRVEQVEASSALEAAVEVHLRWGEKYPIVSLVRLNSIATGRTTP